MRSSHVRPAAGLALIVALATAGCGLKGPLALPEKSERVIIRGPGQTAGPTTSPAAGEAATDETSTGGSATGESATDGAAGGSATGSPTSEAPADKKAPLEERPPPPPLPGGSNPGTARGG